MIQSKMRMFKAHGYHGKILHVDLCSGQIEIEQPDEALCRSYMDERAGRMSPAQNTPAGTDRLRPQYTLMFALSAIARTPISGRSLITAIAKRLWSKPSATRSPVGSFQRR
jgi:aldehyde:ferredoxin oxidoreductase